MTAKETKEDAFEFLALYQLGDFGKKILSDKGYSSFTKKEFIEKYGVGHDYFVQLVKTKDFGDKFFEFVTNGEREKLSNYLAILGNKDPKGWIQLMFSKQAKEAFITEPEKGGDTYITTIINSAKAIEDADIGNRIKDFASLLSAGNQR